MSPLSIVSLATPLYAIHTDLASIYKIYGNGIFLNVLFDDDTGEQNSAQKKKGNRVPVGFAKEQVAHMVETFYNKLFEFQQERVYLQQKRQKEIKGHIFTLVAFIILISLCMGGAGIALGIKGIGKKGEKGRLDFIVWSLLVIVSLILFIIMGVSTFNYASTKTNMKYNTNLKSLPSPLNALMQNLFGKAISDDRGDKPITFENTLLNYFVCQAKGCDPKQATDPSGKYYTHYMTIGLIGWILVRKNLLGDLKLWDRVRKDTLFRFEAKDPYDKFSLWRVFSVGFAPDPGFHPSRVLRAIQQLDPVYQSNALRTSIKRIAEFMHRDNDKEQLNENVIVGKTLQDKFAGVLGVPLVYSTSFVVHKSSLSQAMIDNTITNRMDCVIKAIKSPEYVAAFFQDGNAYFFKTMPLFVYIGKKDDSVGCVIKATIGAKCFIGLGMYNAQHLPEAVTKSIEVVSTFMKDPPIDSFAIQNFDTETRTIKYLTYTPASGLKSVIDVWGIIKGAHVDMKYHTETYQESPTAFVVMDSLKFVGEYAFRVTGATGTYIDIGRKFYIRTCIRLFEDIDPNLSVKIDDRFVTDVVDAFVMQPGGRTRKVIEKDIMSILIDAQAGVTPIVSSQKVSLKYIDLSRFSEKLMNLTEKKFLTGLLKDYMNAYAAAVGLNALQRYNPSDADDDNTKPIAVDIRSNEIDYKEDLLRLTFIWLLVGTILACVALVLWKWDIFSAKFQGEISWTAILDNTITVIVVGVLLRAGMLLAFIWAYKVRIRVTGDFEKKHCADKAAQVLKSSVDVYNCLFGDSIARGDTRIFSENTPKLNLSAENIINVFDKLEHNIYASPDRKIDISGINIKKLWIASINLLEGLEGCNDLLQGFNQPTPFPTFEISIWLIVTLVSIAVIIALWFYMRPGQSLQNIKLYRRMVAEGRTFKVDTHVPLTNEKTNTIIRYSSLITMPIFIVGFCVILIQSTNQLQQSLYANITPMIPVPP